jgi:hypothetical protein
LIELPDVLDERLDAAQGDLAGGHLDTADDRDRDITEVADERGGRGHQPGQELRAEAGAVHLAVELGEPVGGRRPVPVGLHHGEAAVSLLDMRIEAAGVGPLRHEQLLGTPRNGTGGQQRQRHGQHRDQCQQW